MSSLTSNKMICETNRLYAKHQMQYKAAVDIDFD
jgi:hypothetical protein